jgi:hypothetical protein
MKSLAIHENFASSELGNPIILKSLQRKEQSLVKLAIKIHLDKSSRCHFAIPTKICKSLGISKGDTILLRFNFNGNICIDVCTIADWGRTTLSTNLGKFLRLKKGTEISVEILAKANKLKVDKVMIGNKLDLLALMPNYATFERSEGYITLYRKPSRPITIPRFLELNSELLETLYLVWGDGSYEDKLFLANKCPELHLKLSNYFENYLKMPKEFWKLRILLTNKQNSQEAKKYWLSGLKFEEEQLYPTISGAILKTTNVGNARIVLESKAVAELIANLLGFANSNLEKLSLKERLHILNGLLMAEGGTDVTKGNKGLHYLSLSHSQEEKELFEKIIVLCGLNKEFKRTRKDMLKASGWKPLYRILQKFTENDVILMKDHPQRLQRILTFLEHSYVKSMSDYLMALKRNGKLTSSDFVKILKCNKSSVYDYFKKYAQFVKVKGSPKVYELSDDGEKFVRTIETLQKWKEVSNAKTTV